MGIIDTLAIALTARTDGWSKGLSRASKDLSSFSNDVRGHAGKIAGFVGALSGVAAAGGMVALVKHQAEVIESAGSFASRLGTTTEALQSMRFAAEQSEIEIDTFDASIQKLTKNAYNGANASKEVQLALRDLGIDAKAFSDMPLDQKLLTLSDRFSQMADAGRAANDVQALMGKGGQPMLQLFNQGPAAIKEMVAQAKALGLTFSNLDASHVDAASDAVGRAQKVFVGAANAIAIYLAPWLEVLANRFTEAATSSGNFGVTVTTWMERTAQAIAQSAKQMNMLVGVWYLFQSTVNKVAEWVILGFQKMGQAVDWVMSKVPFHSQSAANQTQFANEQQALKEMANQFSKNASTAFDNSAAAFEKFNSGSGSNAVEDFFTKLKQDVAVAAAAPLSAKAAQTTLPDAVQKASKISPIGGRGIDLGATFLGAIAGTKGGQVVKDPQLGITNKILQRIERKVGVAVAG